MTELTSEAIFYRSAALWLAGQLLTVVISTYCADLARSGRVSGWVTIPILAGIIGIKLGAFGLAFLSTRLVAGQGQAITYAVFGASFILSIWISLIFLQFAQNWGYDFIGAKRKPIRWIADYKGKPKRTKS